MAARRGAGDHREPCARSDTGQSGLIGHYAWPILPWIFLAAVFGARRIAAWKPRLVPALAALLVLWTVTDSPLWAAFSRTPWRPWSAAARVRGNCTSSGRRTRVVQRISFASPASLLSLELRAGASTCHTAGCGRALRDWRSVAARRDDGVARRVTQAFSGSRLCSKTDQPGRCTSVEK